MEMDNDSDEDIQTILATIVTVVTTAVTSVTAVLRISESDGRSNRRPNKRKCSNKTTACYTVEKDSAYDKGWYHSQFRCSKSSFDKIVAVIEEEWHLVNWKPCHNAFFSI